MERGRGRRAEQVKPQDGNRPWDGQRRIDPAALRSPQALEMQLSSLRSRRRRRSRLAAELRRTIDDYRTRYPGTPWTEVEAVLRDLQSEVSDARQVESLEAQLSAATSPTEQA
jgi:hypothetical protein